MLWLAQRADGGGAHGFELVQLSGLGLLGKVVTFLDSGRCALWLQPGWMQASFAPSGCAWAAGKRLKRKRSPGR